MRIKENECKVELILSYLIANLMDSRYLLMLIKTKKNKKIYPQIISRFINEHDSTDPTSFIFTRNMQKCYDDRCNRSYEFFPCD